MEGKIAEHREKGNIDLYDCFSRINSKLGMPGVTLEEDEVSVQDNSAVRGKSRKKIRLLIDHIQTMGKNITNRGIIYIINTGWFAHWTHLNTSKLKNMRKDIS